MNIVVLAAGSSSRMGKTNKLLLEVNSVPMVANTCLEALEFLETQKEKSRLIVVTGYRSASTFKALKPCVDFVQNSTAPIEMIIVKNEKYTNGQFSSTKTGVRNLDGESPFFIQLADMPLIKAKHYQSLLPFLKNNDAVRPFCNNTPGHPVLLSGSLRNEILSKPDSHSVSRILEKSIVSEPCFEDIAYIRDIDTSEDII